MFTSKENDQHRAEFIRECKQKSWGAACHADWIAKGLEQVIAEYKKIQEEDAKLEAEIKELEKAVDYHTVDNRQKRKALQEKRNNLANVLKALGQNAQLGQKALTDTQQSMDANLSLIKHAETYEWKEATEQPKEALDA
jgi:cell division septum initiation protein DivIVA